MLEKGTYAVVLLFVLANDGVLISAGNCPGRGVLVSVRARPATAFAIDVFFFLVGLISVGYVWRVECSRGRVLACLFELFNAR